jgi:hypothetical protein
MWFDANRTAEEYSTYENSDGPTDPRLSGVARDAEW